MTNRLGEEDHLYNFEQALGPLLDQVGSVDSDSVSAGVTRNGNSWTFNGVSEIVEFLAANLPFSPLSDYSTYMTFKVLNANGARDPIWGLSVDPGGSTKFPFASWDDATQVNQLYANGNNSTSATNARVTIAEPAPSVLIALAMSVIASTDVVEIAIHTGLGETGADTRTHDANQPIEDNLAIALHNGKYANIEVFQFGTYNTAFSSQDLQDTAASLIAAASNGASSFSKMSLLLNDS